MYTTLKTPSGQSRKIHYAAVPGEAFIVVAIDPDNTTPPKHPYQDGYLTCRFGSPDSMYKVLKNVRMIAQHAFPDSFPSLVTPPGAKEPVLDPGRKR